MEDTTMSPSFHLIVDTIAKANWPVVFTTSKPYKSLTKSLIDHPKLSHNPVSTIKTSTNIGDMPDETYIIALGYSSTWLKILFQNFDRQGRLGHWPDKFRLAMNITPDRPPFHQTPNHSPRDKRQMEFYPGNMSETYSEVPVTAYNLLYLISDEIVKIQSDYTQKKTNLQTS